MSVITHYERARRDAMRREWETNPRATFSGLGKLIGVTAATISSHAKANGWERSKEVAMQAKQVSSARNLANITGAIERGYIPSTEAATAARLGREAPVKYQKRRKYPCWDTRQSERTYTKPLRFASVWDYATKQTDETL